MFVPVKRRRFEVATTGADEFLQNLSSDPYSTSSPSTPNWTGLRIPSLVNDPSTRYLFLLSTRVIQNQKTRVCGIRQGLDIGMDLGPKLGRLGQERPVTLPVTSPNFTFSDGANVSWHLVKEPTIKQPGKRDLRQTQSFMFRSCDGPALLWETFTASTVDPTTGAPINYPLTLTGYTPPNIAKGQWQDIAGLKVFRDMRYPWQDDHAWDCINEDVDGNWRISLYASVLQTDPANRPGFVFGTGIATDGSAVGGGPEDDFIFKYSFAGSEGTPAAGPIFWRVYGSILFEDEVADDRYTLPRTVK